LSYIPTPTVKLYHIWGYLLTLSPLSPSLSVTDNIAILK